LTARLQADRVLSALGSLPVFRGLSEQDRRRLAPLAQIRDFKRGETIWQEGDPAENLTIVVRGRVKIVRHADAGDVIFEIFGEGEPVGAIAVYNYMPYPASAVSLEPTTMLMVPRRDYFELLDRNPEFSRSIIRELTRLVLALTRKLEGQRGQRVESRIAQLFVTLGARMGRETDKGLEIPVHLSRQEIADLVGTTAESAIRVLARWGRERIVITGRGRFLIPSIDRLRSVCEIAVEPGREML